MDTIVVERYIYDYDSIQNGNRQQHNFLRANERAGTGCSSGYLPSRESAYSPSPAHFFPRSTAALTAGCDALGLLGSRRRFNSSSDNSRNSADLRAATIFLGRANLFVDNPVLLRYLT